MTVIACKDGVMAADRAVFQDDIIVGSTTKIHRLTDGSLIAAAGPRPLIQQFRAWMEHGQDPIWRPREPKEDEFGALWLRKDGIWRVSCHWEIYDDPAPFAAEGMGTRFLLGAMAAGASAADAIGLAIRYCADVRGPIQVEHI